MMLYDVINGVVWRNEWRCMT